MSATNEPMQVYVATAWPNKLAAVAAMQRLRSAGFEISHDWTANEAWEWGNENEVSLRAPQAASLDVRGVRAADAFVLLTYNDPSYPMVGSLVEFGVALADPRTLIVLVGDQPTNTFRYHPRVVVVEYIDQAIRYLEYRRKRLHEEAPIQVPR